MSENGILGKDLLRVAKRITRRVAKVGGRPLMERIFCDGGRAAVTDGHILIVVDGVGEGTGYVDPGKLTVAKPAEFKQKDGRLVAIQGGETFTSHEKPEADRDFPDIQKIFPDLFAKSLDGSATYHAAIQIDPVVMLDALDVFAKKSGSVENPSAVKLYLPTEVGGPFVMFGKNDDGQDVRVMIAPLKEAQS